jgi:MSHA biogenesis protein MshK
MAGGLTARIVLAAAALAVAPAAAETLPDPTRPPAGLQDPASAPAAGPAPGAGPVLQSVMISPNRLAAMIDGTLVELGESFGDARLVRVTETGVTLRGASGTQELTLFPAVEKRPVKVDAGKARRSGQKGG